MSGRDAKGSVPANDIVTALVVSSLVLVLGLTAAQRSRAVAAEQRATADEVVLADVATGIAVDLEHGLSEVTETARTATLPGAVAPAGFVPVDAAASSAAPPVLSDSVRSDPRVAAALDRARDVGGAVLTAPVDLGAGPRTLLIAAAFTPDPLLGRPQSTVQRRARITGWFVRPVDLGALAQEHLQPGMVATISDGDATSSTSAHPLPARLPVTTLESHGRQLVVRAGDPAAVGAPVDALGLAAASVVLAAAAAGGVLVTGRRLREHRDQVANREQQVRLIGEVAPLVQQSLELADVLPVVAVQLSDHFGLAGVSLATVTSSAGKVELFSFGVAPDRTTKAVLRPPEHLAAGSTVALALQRGGRSVALLQLVAGRDLDEAELQSLRAISELVTAAVVNAALYASQQETLRRLRDLDALKTVFLGTASHELRTPVTAIGGFAALLNENWDRFEESQRRNFVERIGANARSLGAVVQDLLDFSLLDKGTLEVTIEAVDLGVLVESVVDRLGPLFQDHEIAFSAEPSVAIAGNVNGLERIVTNLLTNAVKFSPAATTVTVAVGPAEDGYGAQVVVSDQGPGIPVEERHQVFTRFFRGSGGEVTQTRGVGIGLSVVAEFVARLRGEVIVDEAPGGGARFTIRFPASSAHLMAKEAAHAPTT